MDEFSQSVMVALLPTTDYWCRIELPHVTLVYAGEIPDLKPTARNELAKETVAIALDSKPMTVPIISTEIFGEEDLVDVLRLELTPELKAMRNRLESWNASQYKDFKPHATIGPVGGRLDNLPARLTFDRILFSWGDHQMVCELF